MRTWNWFSWVLRHLDPVTASGCVRVCAPAAKDVCDAELGFVFFWTPPDRLARKLGDWEAELMWRVSGRGRRFVGGESSKYWSRLGNSSIE